MGIAAIGEGGGFEGVQLLPRLERLEALQGLQLFGRDPALVRIVSSPAGDCSRHFVGYKTVISPRCSGGAAATAAAASKQWKHEIAAVHTATCNVTCATNRTDTIHRPHLPWTTRASWRTLRPMAASRSLQQGE